ncbi:MAG TPA: ATP-binding protein, partial [Steroidobacteraceae bacterium]|nr:ATP-binding protein [Steroidobacteraceae bacterium]
MTRSLKRRMFTSLAMWVMTAWALSLAAVFLYTTYSQSSIWDERMQAMAARLLELAPSVSLLDRPAATSHTQDEGRNLLTFQIWRDGRMIAATANAPQQALRNDFESGFASVSIDGVTWRVYAIGHDVTQVQVGTPRAAINFDFQKHAVRAVSMAAIPLAICGLLLWWAVRRALQPLANIEAIARARSIADLTPLPTAELPAEVLPLVQSFNQLLAQLDQSIQSERRFIGDAAHELRTPLAALLAQLEVALRAQAPDERDHALQKLKSAVLRSARLSEQLLDLARLEAGSRVPLRDAHDLEGIVRHVANEFEVSAQQQRRQLDVEIEPCRILCDIDEIGILVRNLIDNAVRYTSEGGRLIVRCGYRDTPVGRSACIEVIDDGPGVPPTEREAIFQRFHRIKGSSGVRGSGIGLSLVAR